MKDSVEQAIERVMFAFRKQKATNVSEEINDDIIDDLLGEVLEEVEEAKKE